MAKISMKEMLDSGVHFGHQTQRWNPKMKPYVYTSRGGIHIIDLQKSVTRANKAAEFIKKMASQGGRLIFVGTKKQAIEPIKEAAERCGQYYVTKRWLGGTLTNFETIKTSISRLKRIDQMREKGELEFFSKKERSRIEKEYERLSEYLNGIRDMKDQPQAMFIVDLNKEHIAVAEAKKLGIPVVGIADTNTDPDVIEYPIPGNDDAIRSIKLFADLVADAFLEGSKNFQEKLRSESDKAVEPDEAPKAKKPATSAAATSEEGPTVVKTNKAPRKLVAAGLAEVVEIEAELENQDDNTDEISGDEDGDKE